MIDCLYEPFKHWSAQGTVWSYSDPHFNDPEMKKYDRISDEEQLKRINEKVGRKDTLICLGDIGDIEWMRKVRGYKVLIMGNHDKGKSNYMDVFDEVYEGALFVAPKILLSHEPIHGVEWCINIHGHEHDARPVNATHFNVCSNVIDYSPISFNQWVKSGSLSKVEGIHRPTIDRATERKKKRRKQNEISETPSSN